MWAYRTNVESKLRPIVEIKNLVLNSPSVQSLILTKQDSIAAGEIFSKLAADIRPPVLKLFGWFLRKLWRSIYDKVVVDEKTLKKIAKWRQEQKCPTIYLPTHRSYIDFLVISYVLFSYGLEVPYIAAREDFLKILLVNHVLRHSGAFFIKSNAGSEELYQAIFSEYIKVLLRHSQPIEFFLEGTRSRTGKMLHPKLGMLKICTDTYYDGEIKDL